MGKTLMTTPSGYFPARKKWPTLQSVPTLQLRMFKKGEQGLTEVPWIDRNAVITFLYSQGADFSHEPKLFSAPISHDCAPKKQEWPGKCGPMHTLGMCLGHTPRGPDNTWQTTLRGSDTTKSYGRGSLSKHKNQSGFSDMQFWLHGVFMLAL